MLAIVLLASACSAYAPPQNGGVNESPTDPAPGEAEFPWPPEEPHLEPDGVYGVTGGETYSSIDENREHAADRNSTVTFSLKVDTAAYTNVKRYIENGQTPPKDAVRTEELLNYFKYDGKMTFGDEPFAVTTEVGPSPFGGGKYYALIRVATRDIDKQNLPPSNLTFLIDTSGSMESFDKLPLLQKAFSMLVDTLDAEDRVSIVTYAGSSNVVLEGARGDQKGRIMDAIYGLTAAGSTAGAKGIQTAYTLAYENFIKGGNNRVILATDGDFNVGISSTSGLNNFISGKRDSGIYLSVLGFGTGNIRDDIMETLSKHGNGNYAYINSVHTAEKVLVDELSSNLFVIADDVKAQVEFNPENVVSYRLLGYENRQLANEDFTDDTKDAGEIGVGTDVVALFELTLRSEGQKYGNSGGYPDELFEVRLRYKHPGENESIPITVPVRYEDLREANSSDFHFAAAVAGYGQLLRGSSHAGLDVNGVLALAQDSLGIDEKGYRQEFVAMVKNSRDLF